MKWDFATPSQRDGVEPVRHLKFENGSGNFSVIMIQDDTSVVLSLLLSECQQG